MRYDIILPHLTALITTVPKVCEGFERNKNVQTYGEPLQASRSFSIRSGPPPLFFANGRKPFLNP